jgi:hypothetical protein
MAIAGCMLFPGYGQRSHKTIYGTINNRESVYEVVCDDAHTSRAPRFCKTGRPARGEERTITTAVEGAEPLIADRWI